MKRDDVRKKITQIKKKKENLKQKQKSGWRDLSQSCPQTEMIVLS